MISAVEKTKIGVVGRFGPILLFALTGCGQDRFIVWATEPQVSNSNVVVQGHVLAGQEPVVHANVQLYAAGTTGDGSGAKPMFSQALTTDQFGAFSGTYNCGEAGDGPGISAGSQMYLLATGGISTLIAAGNNPSLALMVALGPCENLNVNSAIVLNEVTTVGAIWALAPFMSSPVAIGAASTNPDGLPNAFRNAQLLVDPTTGFPPHLPSNIQIESDKLFDMANVIAGCLLSDGTSLCQPLFAAATPAGGKPPSDTASAVLNIVKHPGQNVVAVFDSIRAQALYASTLLTPPNDWTMAITISGGGLSQPTALAIDSESNVWVTQASGPLAAFGPQGTPLSATGFGQGKVMQSDSLAIDQSGDIWVTDTETSLSTAGGITKFLGSSSNTPGAVVQSGGLPYIYSSSVYQPASISADARGNIFVASSNSPSVTVFANSGSVLTPALGANTGIYSAPRAIAADGRGGYWLSDSDNTVAHFSADGTLLSHPDCCSQSYGLALDASGNAWVADYLGGSNSQGSFSEVAPDGTVLIHQSQAGGVRHPAMVAVDADQNIWMTNTGNWSITEIAGNAGTLPPGTPLSPTAGVYGQGAYGLDAALDGPYGIAIDRSGSVWVTDQDKAAITVFLGLAAPTATPVRPTPTAP